MLVSLQTAVKGGHGFEIAVRMENLRGGDWDEAQNGAHRVRGTARDIKLVFGWFYVFDIANAEIHTWKECKNKKVLKLWTFSENYFVALAFC